MAFIPRLSWSRSKPPILVVGGQFEVAAEYYHHPLRVTEARQHCAQINKRIERNKQRGDV